MTTEMMEFMVKNDIKTRPGADCGIWVLFLLPLSIIISYIKHPIISTPTYKLASILSIGLIFTSLVISFQKYKRQKFKMFDVWIIVASAVTAGLFHVCLHKGWPFSILSGIFSTLAYFKTYKFVLEKFEECFTLGEAGIISQSIVILLYFTILNLTSWSTGSYEFKSNVQISTIIIQLGLLGVGLIACTAYTFNLKDVTTFYTLTGAVIILVIFLPLHIILNQNPVLWILHIIIDDFSTLKLILYWSFCSGIAVMAVSKQILYAQKASTGIRKIFHILALVVYIPGLLYKCSFLYLASGVVTGIFFALEILRILRMPPLGLHLQDGFIVFSDEKDTGNLSLTPIYLLAGCSMPLWIHPSPCDVTDSSSFYLIPLLSGLLSIGLGDTAASVIGSNYGKHFWQGTKKTIEGTIACMLAQIGLIYLLCHFGCIPILNTEQNIRIYFSIFVSSLVEAKTTQVDNLVLPLIMYIMLI